MIRREDIRSALRALAVAEGDTLIVHTSLGAIGPIEGGADVLLDALAALTGERGRVAMPTFTYSFEGNREAPDFNPHQTSSAVGVLSECFRRRPGVIRSAHPTHSIAIRGHDAERIAHGHTETAALGRGSPMHRLVEASADVLLIGVGFDTLSLLHTAESLAGVPYVDCFAYAHKGWRSHGRIMTPTGAVRTIPVIEPPGCSREFSVMEGPAREAGCVREGRIGKASVLRVNGPALLALAVDRLTRKPDLLLCPDGTCQACDVRRPALKA